MTDRDRLIELIWCSGRDYDDYVDEQHEMGMPAHEDFESWLADDLLANDFTKVVRCKDCKCCMVLQDGGVRCERFEGLMMIGATDFCSYGELKERENNA